MSIEQYQREVISLDREITVLEKKKATYDKKAADARKKAANVSISKNASVNTIKTNMRHMDNYNSTALKAEKSSADLQKQIADKRHKRNVAAERLQKEEIAEKKKQGRITQQIMQSYERRIEELQSIVASATTIPAVHLVEEEEQDIPEYDVFVSHAWEDKGDFVDEFVKELQALGIRVWYDTSQIKWGDSMRKRIDAGLRKSRFGVAVLSKNYIKDGKYWTKAELDGLFQLDSIGGKVLLPIWHGLTKKEVMEYSPIIASRKAMNTTSMEPKEIAYELKKLLSDVEDKDNV